jgi:hypothetical protein
MINKNELPILYLGDEFLLKFIFWNISGNYSIFICIAVAQLNLPKNRFKQSGTGESSIPRLYIKTDKIQGIESNEGIEWFLLLNF